jgi:putative membrane protein
MPGSSIAALATTLHGFIGALADLGGGGDPAAAVANGTVVATFLGGVAEGLVTVAHAVRWALRRDRATTLTVLVSLMVGALRLPVAEVLANTPAWTPRAAAGVLAAGAVGVLLVLARDRYTDDLEYGG